MPMINTDQMKEASDKARKSYEAWYAAGRELAVQRDKRPSDIEGIDRAKEVCRAAEHHHNVTCRLLAMHVAQVIAIAEKEASQPSTPAVDK